MNAGSSRSGQAFALRNCDAFFTATSEFAQGRRRGDEQDGRRHQGARPRRSAARSRSSPSARWSAVRPRRRPRTITATPSSSRPTGARSTACWRSRTSRPQTVGEEEYKKKREYFASRAIGGYPFVGTPDHIAEELAYLSRGGIRGIALLDDQLSRRIAVVPRRGAAAPRTDGCSRIVKMDSRSVFTNLSPFVPARGTPSRLRDGDPVSGDPGQHGRLAHLAPLDSRLRGNERVLMQLYQIQTTQGAS